MSLSQASARGLGIATLCFVFFFNDTATTEIYTLSLHDALPIFIDQGAREGVQRLLRRIAKLEGLPEFFDGSRRIAARYQDRPQQVPRLSIVGRLLQGIPELDYCRVGIVLGKITPGRLDQQFGRIAATGGEQHDTEPRDHTELYCNVQSRLLHFHGAFVYRRSHRCAESVHLSPNRCMSS